MRWWAVLIALSSLARYRPVVWPNALSLGQSPVAAVLERTSTLAQAAVPHLVLETHRSVDSDQLLLRMCCLGR